MICPQCKEIMTEEETKHVNKKLVNIGLYNYKHSCGAFVETNIDPFS